MRISDWSSDVCSSDLSAAPIAPEPRREAEPGDFHDVRAAWDFGIAEALEVIGEQVRANRRQQPHRPGMSAVRIGGDQIMGVIAVISVDFILASDDWHGPAELVDELLRSEEHTSELQSLMRISYAVFCLKKKN